MSNTRFQTLFMSLLLLLSSSLALAAEDDGGAVKKTPGYVSLGKPMVLNLATDGRRLAFLQIQADVLVKDDEAKEVVEANIPAIRHKLIVMLSEQNATDMKTPAKREEIRKQVTDAVRDMIEEMTNNNDIDEVLFSSFLVQ